MADENHQTSNGQFRLVRRLWFGFNTIRVQFLLGFLLFFCLFTILFAVNAAYVLELRSLSEKTPTVVSLVESELEYSILIEEIEGVFGIYLVAQYPVELENLLIKLEQAERLSRQMKRDASVLGISGLDIAQRIEQLSESIEGIAVSQEKSGGQDYNALVRGVYDKFAEVKKSRGEMNVLIKSLLIRLSDERSHLFNRLYGGLGLIGAVIIFLLFGFFVVIQLAIISPLHKLTKFTDRMRRGIFGEKSPVTSSNELGALGKTLEATSLALRDRKRLEEHSHMLEEELRKRTKVLEKKVRQYEIIQEATVEREMKMVDLKKRIDELEREISGNKSSGR